MDRNDVELFSSFIGAQTKEHGDELWFKKCPYCGDNSKDEYKFSVNLISGAFKCFRATCGKTGHFVELCRDFGYQLIDEEEPKTYKKLYQQKLGYEPKEAAVAYLENRGIGHDVAKRYGITVRKDAPFVMAIPFYDENGVLRFIKYRDMMHKQGDKGSKEFCEKDTEPILFGMFQCVDRERLVITEGQMDALACAEAGVKNPCSVPTGANGFRWVTSCREFVESFKEIVIFGDHEHGRITLIDEMIDRFPGKRILCVRKEDYLGEKDANDILRNYGAENVRKAVENAEPPKIGNIIPLSDVKVVDMQKVHRIRTGVWTLDKYLGGGIPLGTLTVLSGKRGEGKSTFGSQLVCSALNQDERVLIYSGELPDYTVKHWIDRQLAGNDHLIVGKDSYDRDTFTIPDDVQKRISEWYKGKAWVYDNDAGTDEMLATAERLILQEDVRFILIDNMMTAMESIITSDNIYSAQSKFAGDLKKLAMKYGVAIILVAHPRKSPKGGSYEFDADDVSGSGDITNKCDILLNYKRVMASGSDEHDGLIEIKKNRPTGELKSGDHGIAVMYSKGSMRIYGCSEGDGAKVVYGWEETRQASYFEGAQVLDVGDIPVELMD